MEYVFKELEKFGLGHLSGDDIYEKKEAKMIDNATKKKTEKDFLFEKNFSCPVCQKEFKAKVLKSKTAQYIGEDFDCKPHYKGIEVIKYNITMCPHCGYANTNNDFNIISQKQKEMFKEAIKKPIDYPYNKEICTKGEAIMKFKMALATAMIIKTKYSKKAMLCLQLAWLYRSFRKTTTDTESKDRCLLLQKYFYKKAYEGFTYALELERPPFSVWKDDKFYYVYSCLAFVNGDTEKALKTISEIVLTKSGSRALKDKARDLRDYIKERE